MAIRGISACGRRSFAPGQPSKTIGYCFRPRGHSRGCSEVAFPDDPELDDGEGPCPDCGSPGEGYGCGCLYRREHP